MNNHYKIIYSVIIIIILLNCLGCFNNLMWEKQEFKIQSIELQVVNKTKKNNVKYLLNLVGVEDPIVEFKYYTNEEFKVGDIVVFYPTKR